MNATKRKPIQMTTRPPRGKQKGASKRAVGKTSPTELRDPETLVIEEPISILGQYLSFCAEEVTGKVEDILFELHGEASSKLREERAVVPQEFYAEISAKLMLLVPEILIAVLRMTERDCQADVRNIAAELEQSLETDRRTRGTESRKETSSKTAALATRALQRALAMFPEAGALTDRFAEECAATRM
jgi:hypothetical protein